MTLYEPADLENSECLGSITYDAPPTLDPLSRMGRTLRFEQTFPSCIGFAIIRGRLEA
jgi:hypothetical protein